MCVTNIETSILEKDHQCCMVKLQDHGAQTRFKNTSMLQNYLFEIQMDEKSLEKRSNDCYYKIKKNLEIV